MNMVRKLACGVMCFAAMIASATTTTNFDFFVEYIQSSGTQWMDTGVIGKSTVNLSVDIMVLNTAGSSCIVGERASSSDKSQRLGLWVGGQYKFALNCGSIDSLQVGSAYQNTRCVVSNENGRLWVAAEGGIPTKIHNGGNQTFTSSLSMTVFFLNTATGLDMGSNRPLTARLYGMTIHDDGVLIRNFRPCRATIADANEGTSVSKYGLWDTVNDVFYGDLSGGADFTAPEQASDIVVEQNAHGLEGVEPPGPYIVDDNRTFSATNLTIGPISWVPVGYSLEKWDAGNGVWNYFKTEQGNSFAYTNNAENGRMRLTWLWTQTGNVRRYGLGDYIQTAGLVGHFDGIYNAGRSAAHAASPGTWVDLAGKFNLTRSGTSGFSADSWVANGSTFYTGSSAGPRDALIAGKFTLEMMISSPQIGSNSYGTWVFLGNNNDRQLCVDMRSANSQNPLIQGIQYLGGGSWNDGAVVQNWGGTKTKWNTRQYIAIVCDGNTATGYCDGTNQFHSITVPGVTPSLTQVGVGVRASDSGNKLINGAEICALRMTSQALEGWQLEHNSAVDHARFCNNVTVVNGAIGETGENGASSAPNGDYDLLSGTWTITADDIDLPGAYYAPKLTVEKLTDGAWVVTDILEFVNSYTVDKDVLGDGRIRLTWTWFETDPTFGMLAITTSAAEDVSTPSPGYGNVSGLAAGDHVAVSCGITPWTNAYGSVAYSYTGWKLYDNDGNELSNGVETAFTYTHPTPASFRRLEWQWAASPIDGAYAPGEHGGDLVIAANARGLEGVEIPGSYTVNASRTFAATNVTDGFFVWSAVGHKVEKWNAATGKWDYFKTEQGNSFTYVNNVENGRMRLTWLWSQTGNVRQYGVGDYIQTTELIGHFDGIYNAGTNAAHASSLTTWKNLAGGFDLSKYGGVAGFTNDAWVANGSTIFRGDSVDVMNALYAKKFTLEMMISYSYPPTSDYETWFYAGDLTHRQLGVDIRKNYSTHPLVQGLQYLSAAWNDDALIPASDESPTRWNTRQYIAVVCDGDTATGYCDGTNRFHSITVSGIDATLTNFGVGGRNDNNSNAAILQSGAEICAVRMTAGALEGWQLIHNSAVDHARFAANVKVVNGEVADTGVNGTSAVPDGDYDFVSGIWTLKAGYVYVGGRCYSPRMTVETLTNGVWVVSGQRWGNAFTIDKSAIGDSQVRLTWTWGTPPGSVWYLR